MLKHVINTRPYSSTRAHAVENLIDITIGHYEDMHPENIQEIKRRLKMSNEKHEIEELASQLEEIKEEL